MLSGLVALCLIVSVPTTGELVRVDFPDGDRLSGKIVSVSGDSVVINHAVLGKVTVPLDAVQASEANAKSGKGQSAKSANTTQPHQSDSAASSKAVPSPPPDPWKASISLAATASQTTSSTYNTRLGVEAHYKTDAEQFDVTGSWYWNQSNGRTSDNDILVRAAQQWFIADSRWLYFAQGTWQYDQFEEWTHRVSPYGGMGYKLVDDDSLKLTLKGGAGATWRYHGNSVDPQLLFEVNTNWNIDERQQLEGFASIAPNPTDWSNYLLTLKLDWKLKIADDSPWSFSLGIRNIYDSNPTGDSDGNDLKAYAGLSMDF